jgi:SOS-response transcriptional repressor LexA
MRLISANRINKQASIYPLLATARISSLAHYPQMSESGLVERIKIVMRDRKVTQAELAKVAGMPSQSAMSNVLKGIRRLTLKEAAEIKTYLGLEETPSVQWVPLIGLAYAGNWNEAIQMSGGSIAIPMGKAGREAFAVEIRGDSMDKLLPEGGWAVVDPAQINLFTGRVYLIQNGDDDVTIKRYASDPARLEPVSNNDMHKPIMLTGLHYRVIGRVVAYGNDEGL